MNTIAGRRVLVLDDEILIAMMVSESLKEYGFDIVGPAKSIEEATLLIDNSVIDVALLDVKVEDQRCFPVADALRARGIPFAFITGYPEKDLLASYPDTQVVTKPFLTDYLVGVLSELLKET